MWIYARVHMQCVKFILVRDICVVDQKKRSGPIVVMESDYIQLERLVKENQPERLIKGIEHQNIMKVIVNECPSIHCEII